MKICGRLDQDILEFLLSSEHGGARLTPERPIYVDGGFKPSTKSNVDSTLRKTYLDYWKCNYVRVRIMLFYRPLSRVCPHFPESER